MLEAEACEAIGGATVEVWHADADGAYSAFGPGAGETFLRGAQRTGGDGLATFTTIYPGWYMGRTVHIHVKVHVGADEVHRDSSTSMTRPRMRSTRTTCTRAAANGTCATTPTPSTPPVASRAW